MNEYNDYIENVRSGAHYVQNEVVVFMNNDWSNRVGIIKENISVDIPVFANIEAKYDSIHNETRICFKWSTFEKGII